MSINVLVTLISFVFVLGIIVLVHELGHFLAAKAVGARVEVFSLGFPPKMFGIQKGETEYRIGWVPLGGYVKIAGMIDESLEEDSITGAPDEFMSKSMPAKMFIITAGVIMNFLLGFLIYSSITLFEGKKDIDTSSTVGTVKAEYPAALAGIQDGDRIIEIDNQEIQTWQDLTQSVHSRPGETLLVKWVRGQDTLSADITTRVETISDGGEDKEYGFLGVGYNVISTETNFIESIQDGASTTYRTVALSLESMYKLITRKESIKAVAGPVAIMQFSGETARAGWSVFVGFIGFISISIGLLNIMPFPMLDGGHLVYIIIEGLIRRPIPVKLKIILQQVGMALILLLIVVVTYNDITRIFSN